MHVDNKQKCYQRKVKEGGDLFQQKFQALRYFFKIFLTYYKIAFVKRGRSSTTVSFPFLATPLVTYCFMWLGSLLVSQEWIESCKRLEIKKKFFVVLEEVSMYEYA